MPKLQKTSMLLRVNLMQYKHCCAKCHFFIAPKSWHKCD